MAETPRRAHEPVPPDDAARSSGAARPAGRFAAGPLALIVVAVIACLLLGMWQWGRFQDRLAEARQLETMARAAPVPLDRIAAPLPTDQAWRPVAVRGTYCASADCVLYVRGRVEQGDVGLWQLVPLRTEQGTTVLVVRGWVPEGPDGSIPSDPPPIPGGEVTVTARIRPAEPTLPSRSDPPGQAQTVTPPVIASRLSLPGPVREDAYLVAEAESPQPASRPRPIALPEPSLGPHLAYAVQWWLFALAIPVGVVVTRRRNARDREDAPTSAAHRDRAPSRRAPTRRTPSDEEAEDALLDGR
ncbi:SURF1 family protein [Brachybacterium sp. EF45031]|uniref:SURF1 family cytochrome oxidase biogenesis protein n=1 Tax=Brachybacterium sillae TaxID=2810536 RepID=UPI00217CC5D0|nr:SURF1 family protein [Brachybacterium sillae]MCS6710655.1 SURF1 family protein [Brachybacterium sillae]